MLTKPPKEPFYKDLIKLGNIRQDLWNVINPLTTTKVLYSIDVQIFRPDISIPFRLLIDGTLPNH